MREAELKSGRVNRYEIQVRHSSAKNDNTTILGQHLVMLTVRILEKNLENRLKLSSLQKLTIRTMLYKSKFRKYLSNHDCKYYDTSKPLWIVFTISILYYIRFIPTLFKICEQYWISTLSWYVASIRVRSKRFPIMIYGE